MFRQGRWMHASFGMNLDEQAMTSYAATCLPLYRLDPLLDFVIGHLGDVRSDGSVGRTDLSSATSEDSRFVVLQEQVSSLNFALRKLAEKLDQLRDDRGDGDFALGRLGNDDPRVEEDSDVDIPVVNMNSIAAAVQSFGIVASETWNSIRSEYPGVELFAIDADPRSFDVNEQGRFEGRADILVSVPRTLRSGRKSSISLTIAAKVFGQLSPQGEIEVSEFRL